VQKNIEEQKRNACAKFKRKKLWSGIFPILKFPSFLILSKIYSTEFFLILPVSCFVCNKKIFIRKQQMGSPL